MTNQTVAELNAAADALDWVLHRDRQWPLRSDAHAEIRNRAAELRAQAAATNRRPDRARGGGNVSIRKGHQHEHIEPRRPFDRLGQYVPMQCPRCGSGALVYEGNKFWRCSGLDDPNDENKELIACEWFHIDGEERVKP